MELLLYLLVISSMINITIFQLPPTSISISLYRILIVLILILAIVRFFTNKPKIKTPIPQIIKNNSFTAFYIFWILYALLSIFWVKSITNYLLAVIFITVGSISIIYTIHVAKDKRVFLNIFKVFFIGSIIHQIFAWIEVIFHKYYLANTSAPQNGIPRTTFTNQNDLATLLLAGIFVSLILFLNSKNLYKRIFILLTILSAILLINKTESRANILALIVGIVAFVIIRYSNSKFYKAIGMLVILLCAISVVLLLIPTTRIAIIDLISDLFARIQDPQNPGEQSIMYRVNMILNGFNFLRMTYGFGTGAGNIEFYMTNYATHLVDAQNMHNWFMELLVSFGVIFFVLYMLIYISSLVRILKSAKTSSSEEEKNISQVIAAYLFAFVFSSMATSTNIYIEWLWVFRGIIIAYSIFISQKSNTIEKPVLQESI